MRTTRPLCPGAECKPRSPTTGARLSPRKQSDRVVAQGRKESFSCGRQTFLVTDKTQIAAALRHRTELLLYEDRSCPTPRRSEPAACHREPATSRGPSVRAPQQGGTGHLGTGEHSQDPHREQGGWGPKDDLRKQKEGNLPTATWYTGRHVPAVARVAKALTGPRLPPLPGSALHPRTQEAKEAVGIY